MDEEAPRTILFGKEISDKHQACRTHRSSSSGVVGVFILIAGCVLLLNSLGIAPWSVWDVIRSWWPVFIVLLGIEMLVGRGFFGKLVTVILSVAIFGMIALAALQRSEVSLFVPASAEKPDTSMLIQP